MAAGAALQPLAPCHVEPRRSHTGETGRGRTGRDSPRSGRSGCRARARRHRAGQSGHRARFFRFAVRRRFPQARSCRRIPRPTPIPSGHPAARFDAPMAAMAATAADRRTRHGLLRAHLRRPLLPDAAPRRRLAGRAVQVVLPGQQDHGVLTAARSTTRSAPTARATPISTTPSPIATSVVDELHLQRQGRARPRARRRRRRSDPARRATSSRPTTAS